MADSENFFSDILFNYLGQFIICNTPTYHPQKSLVGDAGILADPFYA